MIIEIFEEKKPLIRNMENKLSVVFETEMTKMFHIALRSANTNNKRSSVVGKRTANVMYRYAFCNTTAYHSTEKIVKKKIKQNSQNNTKYIYFFNDHNIITLRTI